jgi:excisionase family DNA binding protein
MAEPPLDNDEMRQAIRAMRTEVTHETVSTSEAANLLGISPSTLLKWVREGRASARTISGELRFTKEELRRLFQGRKPGA